MNNRTGFTLFLLFSIGALWMTASAGIVYFTLAGLLAMGVAAAAAVLAAAQKRRTLAKAPVRLRPGQAALRRRKV